MEILYITIFGLFLLWGFNEPLFKVLLGILRAILFGLAFFPMLIIGAIYIKNKSWLEGKKWPWHAYLLAPILLPFSFIYSFFTEQFEKFEGFG